MPNNNIYLPVLVGATQNYHKGMQYQRDDEGKNISRKNPNYSELTAIYWAWKNLDDVDAIGLVHYRRYFFEHGKADIKNVVGKDLITKEFKKSDLILPRKRKYYIETNYSHYVHAHHREPLDMTREIIKIYSPEYLDDFDNVMKRRSAHMFNMFIMKKEFFDSYASWLFGILNKLEDKVDITNYSAQESRVYGYISELLLDVWVLQNNVNYSEIRWDQIGPKRNLLKMWLLLKRKFSGSNSNNIKTHFE